MSETNKTEELRVAPSANGGEATLHERVADLLDGVTTAAPAGTPPMTTPGTMPPTQPPAAPSDKPGSEEASTNKHVPGPPPPPPPGQPDEALPGAPMFNPAPSPRTPGPAAPVVSPPSLAEEVAPPAFPPAAQPSPLPSPPPHHHRHRHRRRPSTSRGAPTASRWNSAKAPGPSCWRHSTSASSNRPAFFARGGWPLTPDPAPSWKTNWGSWWRCWLRTTCPSAWCAPVRSARFRPRWPSG